MSFCITQKSWQTNQFLLYANNFLLSTDFKNSKRIPKHFERRFQRISETIKKKEKKIQKSPQKFQKNSILKISNSLHRT